eukprot:g8969.t1
MGDKEEDQSFTIHGSVFRDKPGSVKTTRLLHRFLPISAQRSFRDGAFRTFSDYGVAVGAGVSAVFRPKLASRFLAVGRQREDYRYGPHPRQIIEVVHPTRESVETKARARERGGEKPKLVVFVHGGAWGSGCTWMYRLLVDRLTRSNHPPLGSYTVASVGYRVYPDADTSGQVHDLAEAMRWISGNVGTIGFDCSPDVYLMGHSSGAHISLLYLIRHAEQQEAAAVAAAAAAAAIEDKHNNLLTGSLESRGDDSTRVGGGSSDGSGGDSDGDGDGAQQALLRVEGFIGLAGVYDVHRHYLYESWRGVHEISPMKASHGGMLHTLFDYSHPHLLSGKAHRAHGLSRGISLQQGTFTSSARTGDEGDGDVSSAVSGNSYSGEGGLRGHGSAFSRGRALGRRLPRCLVVHGTADATVPFSQTAAVGAALITLGVPTLVRYDLGGDHFGMVGQLMFTKQSLVETAISQFTSQQAKDDAVQQRSKDDAGATHTSPPPSSPELHSRL